MTPQRYTRYDLYAKAVPEPLRSSADFIRWLNAQWVEWRTETGELPGVTVAGANDHFDAWLAARVTA